MARTLADITIHRTDGTTLTVPITPEARRTWRLMREDNIRLRWDSATEYRAMVGDRVDDELFGPFYITEAQDPSIDPSTGAYRHDIRFDREYVGWRNVLHMLVYDDNGSDARKETEWHLTDNLANQLSVVTRNLAVLGYSYTYSVDDVDEASRAIAMSFSGTSIYDALNAMADAWKCEWWVTYNSGYTAGVIHMGRMETSASRYIITLGDNAETINASKSEAEYANRIFAYGSTRNIPDTYRKTLVFTVTDTQTLAGGTVFRDSARVIRKDMLKIGDTDSEKKTVSLGTPAYEEDGGGRQYKAVMSDTVVLSRDTSFGIAGALSYDMVFTRFGIPEELERTWGWRLKVDDTVLGSGSGIFSTHEEADGRATKSLREDISASATLAAGTHAVTLEIWTDYDEFALSSVTPNSWKLTLTPSGWSVDCPLVYNGNTYTVRFNPQSDASSSGFNWFSFPDGAPSGFGVGKTYTLPFSDGDSAGLLMLKVPVSYYTDNMGDSMRMVGQKRLMLPSPGYVQSSGAGVRRVVEKVVIFEEEYPKLDLTVADIQTGTYTDNTEWSDGSRSYGTLPKYTVKLKQSGTDFPFRKDYLTTDPLSLKFTSGKLLGMTFGVNFNQADMTYTIAFNEDYGAKLPNGVLRPENGDSVVLTGWNTGAIQSLGLVSAAEQRLLADARAYLSAVSEPSLSLSCAMMSDRMVSSGLLSEGRKVRVVRGNLTVDTRVIGYEYKLDIPEDTPVYECGETDAYSRLRALEKALRASTQSVSSSGNAVSGSSVSSGGGSATLNGSLSWVSGNIESFQPDTFDGNGDKTLTIPTEIGHLAGNNQLPRIGGTIETLEDGARVVDLLDSSGNRILPSGSLDWFIAESYEEEGETKYRLKLNPKYQGMYAEGWVSAGGLSDGGGSTPTGDYLPLSGGDMTGSVRMEVGSTATYRKAYALGHTDGSSYVYDGYLAADSNGKAWLYGRTDCNIVAGYGSTPGWLKVTATDVTFNGTSLLNGGGSYTLPAATTDALGGVKVSAVETGTARVITTLYGNRYGLKIDADGKAYIDIPSPGTSVSWGTTSGNVSPLTVNGTTKSVLLSGWAPDLSGYLPLTAGSSKPLTGPLNIKLPGSENTYYDYLLFRNSDNTEVASMRVTGVGHIGLYATQSIEFMAGNTRRFTVSGTYGLYPEINGTITLTSAGAFSSLGNGYDIGRRNTSTTSTSNSRFIRAVRSRMYYLTDDVYIYYDTVNNCIRANAPIASDSYVSAGGVQST